MTLAETTMNRSNRPTCRLVDLAQTYENRKLQNSPKQQKIYENQQFETHLKYSNKLSVVITVTVTYTV